ncbi:MAG: hypothetical protein GC189_06985 [Alphaproteobacteria bacterium]|nr:hypothetical protein [Alphaproteobacteria bacterium]
MSDPLPPRPDAGTLAAHQIMLRAFLLRIAAALLELFVDDASMPRWLRARMHKALRDAALWVKCHLFLMAASHPVARRRTSSPLPVNAGPGLFAARPRGSALRRLTRGILPRTRRSGLFARIAVLRAVLDAPERFIARLKKRRQRGLTAVALRPRIVRMHALIALALPITPAHADTS